jgi:hypothetical protein
VVESTERWSDVVSLSHLEVLSEVLISAPPVGVNHANSLISSDLMEVGVSNIVFLVISRHSSITVRSRVVAVDLSNVPLPLLNHRFLLFLGNEV